MRRIALPLLAVALVATVIGVQVASGGADYGPPEARDACSSPLGPRPPAELEPLAELIVLSGLDAAACDLGVTRERLVLGLATAAERRELAAQAGTSQTGLARSLRSGLARGVERLDRAGRLPPLSRLLPSIVGELGLPGIAEAAIRRIPARVVDELLPTRKVLDRSLERLDVERLLERIDRPDELEAQLRDAIREGAIATARERLRDQLPF